MDDTTKNKVAEVKKWAYASWRNTLFHKLTLETNYSHDELRAAFEVWASQDRLQVFSSIDEFISAALEGKLGERSSAKPQEREVDKDRVMLNIIEAAASGKASCKRLMALDMPDVIRTPSLAEDPSYKKIVHELNHGVDVLDRPLDVCEENLAQTILRGKLNAFACYTRDAPYGKCTLQAAVTLETGKALRALIATEDASRKPRKWEIRSIQLADSKPDLDDKGSVLSLEARIPLRGNVVHLLSSALPTDVYFEEVRKVNQEAMSGSFMSQIMDETRNHQLQWRRIGSSEPKEKSTASTFDCTSKPGGYALGYKQIEGKKGETYEQVLARKGNAIFRFRRRLSVGQSSWLGVISGSRAEAAIDGNGSARTGGANRAGAKPSGSAKKRQPTAFTMSDAIVCSYFGKCAKYNHPLVSMQGSVYVITRKGERIESIFPLTYCEKCHKSFISEKTYENLRKQGVICCRVIEESKPAGKEFTWTQYDNWNDQSVLNQCGYNVNAKEDLTEKQRQEVLTQVIECGILNKQKIMDFIQFQIRQRSGRPNMDLAVSKWKSDLNFLEHYKVSNRSVKVRSIRDRR